MAFGDFERLDFSQLGGSSTSPIAKAHEEASGNPNEFTAGIARLIGRAAIEFGEAGIDLGVEKIGSLFDDGDSDAMRAQFTGVQPDAATTGTFGGVLGGVSGMTVAIVAGVAAVIAGVFVFVLRSTR